MSSDTLLQRLAHRHGIQPEAARRRLVRCAFSGWRHPAMALIVTFSPDTFTVDQALIEETARARTLAEVAHAVEVFRYRSKGEKSWIRNGLGVRASGRRIMELAKEVLTGDA
jgi:hypothetical protein